MVIDPDAFNDLKDLISNVEFVVKRRVRTRGLTLDVEFHQALQKVVIGKLTTNKLVAQDSTLQVHQRPGG
jgi:hypothetical protein